MKKSANCHTILVVDDEPKMCATLSKVLTHLGYAVQTALDGEEAWDLFQAGDFDCVLMDIKMPRLNGYDLLLRIKEKRPECRVLMTTAVSSETMVSLCMKAGASDYLLKPVNLEKLTQRIENAFLTKPSPSLNAAPRQERLHENN